jgi:SET domain-containing protein
MVYPIKTQYKGWGLAAGEFIPKNSFVMQYVGEVFSTDSDIGSKRIKRYKHSKCTYLMRIENNEVIDPTYSGNIARFINHSCDPNCQTRKWTIQNEICVGIFAQKDILENEELTFDYQFDFFKTAFTKCYCGAAKCKGFLGVARNTDADSSSSLEESDEEM